MSIYEIVLDSSYFNQSCINRWNYISSGTVSGITGSQALMSAMGFLPTGDPPAYPLSTIFQRIRDVSVTAVTFTQVIAKNIKDPLDFWTASFEPGTAGLLSAVGLGPFNAAGFRTTRTRSDIARGTKRFVGFPANGETNGGVIVPDHIALLHILAQNMGINLTYTGDGSNITFHPAIIQKLKYDVPNSNPVRHAYKYYPTEAEQVEHSMQGFVWEEYTTVRSQTSRQYGKGQ